MPCERVRLSCDFEQSCGTLLRRVAHAPAPRPDSLRQSRQRSGQSAAFRCCRQGATLAVSRCQTKLRHHSRRSPSSQLPIPLADLATLAQNIVATTLNPSVLQPDQPTFSRRLSISSATGAGVAVKQNSVTFFKAGKEIQQRLNPPQVQRDGPWSAVVVGLHNMRIRNIVRLTG